MRPAHVDPKEWKESKGDEEWRERLRKREGSDSDAGPSDQGALVLLISPPTLARKPSDENAGNANPT